MHLLVKFLLLVALLPSAELSPTFVIEGEHMTFTNGLAREEFLQHMFEEFPSAFNNNFSRTMLENIVDYGTADNFTHTKNELYYFLKDMIPEIQPEDLLPYMDKAVLTSEVLQQYTPRLDALRDYKSNEESLQRAAKQQLQDKTEELIARVRTLEPRINELIATGNACLQSCIPLTGQGFGCVESYDTHQFFTNSWSHLVGFVGNPNKNPCHIEYLGINGGGACGSYHFRTDGVDVFSVHENNSGNIVKPSIRDLENFLARFDTFESAFYSYVDKTIEKQKRALSDQIQSAAARASGTTAKSTPPTIEEER